MKENLEKLTEAYGEIITLTGPSGYKYTLRQQTGDDDDIISNAHTAADGTSSNKFIEAIVIQTDHPEAVNGKLNLAGVLNLKLCDKYFIMLASRIFSVGQILKFEYEWPGLPAPTGYEEDLGLYLWDYGSDKPYPVKGEPEYFKFRIPPHKHGKLNHREIELSSGKKVRYNFVNGNSEKFLMGLEPEQQSINAELKSRNLELFMGKDWVVVQNFKTFSPIDMRELRKDVTENDQVLELVSEIENPKTKEIINFPIIGTSDFFFPREI